MRRWLARVLGLALALLAAAAQAEPRQVLVMLQLPAPHFRPDQAYGGSYGSAAGSRARAAIAAELARRHGLRAVESWPMPDLQIDCQVFDVPDGRAPAAVAEAVARDPRVAWAQPVQQFSALAADPLLPAQPAAAAWQLARLHERAQGRGVSVALVDSGVDTRHPDLLGRVAVAENFVDAGAPPAERHGTAVAGIVGAAAGNGAGIAGIAPQARLLALRGCWQEATATRCSTMSLARALYAAGEHGAHVVNMSLAGPEDRLLARLVDRLIARGTTVVAAHDATRPGGGFPATHPGVLAVAGQPRPGAVVAPGEGVPVPQPGGGWDIVSGASYAAAHASGLAALLHEAGRPLRFTLHPDGRIDACASLGAPCAAP